LNYTDETGPIRLFNQDLMQDRYYNNTPLYGNIPYLVGHEKGMTSSIAWMNAAETWVNLLP